MSTKGVSTKYLLRDTPANKDIPPPLYERTSVERDKHIGRNQSESHTALPHGIAAMDNCIERVQSHVHLTTPPFIVHAHVREIRRPQEQHEGNREEMGVQNSSAATNGNRFRMAGFRKCR